jgi:hypothetical protein
MVNLTYFLMLDGIDKCRWKEGTVHAHNCKPFPVTEAERNHVTRRTRFHQHRDTSCQSFFSLEGKALKEIHTILREI